MISSVIAAAITYTFTAVATGMEKGAPVEFFFAGNNSDRDYETMFFLEGTTDDFCCGLEQAGFPRGMPIDEKSCVLWPVGCAVKIEPKIEDFVVGVSASDKLPTTIIYTGGTRTKNGGFDCVNTMPASLFSIYTLGQSPFVYDGVFNQGDMYGRFVAKETIKKGTKIKFTITCDPSTMPAKLQLTAKSGKGAELLGTIRKASEKGCVNALVDFDGELSVKEAVAVANALSAIDSMKIKINGLTSGNIFYRAFLPSDQWLDRQKRLSQPFELTIGATNQLVFIEEDWSVEGDDPKLTPKPISFDAAKNYPHTTTCFIYAKDDTKLADIFKAMKQVVSDKIKTWYIFGTK